MSYDTDLGRPSRERLRRIADRWGMALDGEELDDYAALLDAALDDVETVLSLPEPAFDIADVSYPERPSGHRPRDDPLDAWILRCTVEGADSGPLSGQEVGLKDSIALAGYEMTCGSRAMRGFVPRIDATVAERLLDAGATITGKLNMEAFAWSGSSDTSDFGTVPNPHDGGRLAGGSSSGCGAAVATGDCDVAIGGDQGGSIRIPAAWCGVVGLKPTTGLVPYTGAVGLDPTIDHLGPFARDVETAATALSAIAGEDVRDGVRMDARQPRGVEADDYAGATGEGVDGLTVGVLEEGFGWDASEPGIDGAVMATVSDLESRGATIREVSVPLHREILPLLTPMEVQGGTRLIREGGVGTHHTGWYWTGLVDAVAAMRRARADDLPPTAKHALLVGAYLEEEYDIEPYARAKNLALDLERQYDDRLAACDVLVTPTVPIHPFERDDALGRVDRVGRIVANHRNTAQFDHTHHPALTVPCGEADGLPVGFQVVGRKFDERTVLRVGAAVEDASDWNPA